MFLTTEPSLVGKNYHALRIVFATKQTNKAKHDATVENALAEISSKATSLGADGVIGVHVSITEFAGWYTATVMGTAIKFY